MNVTATERIWHWRALAALLILESAALHLVYLANNCPLDLAPDEAHYWDWSRHLDLSYYSKGPLVAYLIRAGCELAGPWSRQLTGTEMLAVRLPAVICGSLLLVSMYVLTLQVFRRERLSVAVVAIGLTLPLFAAGSSLMTIDAPYTCCWGWALVLGHQAIFRGSRWAWPLLGLVVGIGILAKYTMILWVPSAALFLLTSPAYRRLLFARGFWSMCVLAALCCTPILIWNVQNHWVSLKHVGGQAGATESTGLRWMGPLNYFGAQFALLLGYWFLAWAAALIAHRPWRETDAGIRYLWWMSAPMFGLFLFFSVKTTIEPNWPVTAYLSGMLLATAWLAGRLQSPRLWLRRLTVGGILTTCGLGLAVILLMHESGLAQPVLLRLSGPATPQQPLPLRRFDPTCRLRGWRFLAAEVDRIRIRLRVEGIEPVIVCTSWTLPGELGFYCEGHPQVYSVGSAIGERRSQYDLWRPNPLADANYFRGRTAIFVGNPINILPVAFDLVEESIPVVYRERGQPIATWTLTVCRGFRNFPCCPSDKY